MEQLRPIFWGQGMFLRPQHFQQQDRYHEARLWRHLQLFHPYCWGVKSLEIDETALQNFLFEVKYCELLTCDGTIICFQNGLQKDMAWSNAQIERRSFKKALEIHLESPSRHVPLAVYLGFRRLQRRECNIAYDDQAGSNNTAGKEFRRFKIEKVPTPDLFMEHAEGRDLQYLMHEVQLLFEGDAAVQNKDNYEHIKIAELIPASEGEGATLSKRYIPPALSVHASGLLEDMLKGIRNSLTATGRSLAEHARTHGRQTRNLELLLDMQAVSRYIPVFDIFLETEEIHPYTYYVLLRQFVAELSTFSETVPTLAGDLPPYRHDELWKCFDAVTRVAHELIRGLRGGTTEACRPFKFYGDRGEKYFAVELDKAFLEAHNRHYLAVRVKTEMKLADLEQSLMVSGRVCARENLAELKPNALPGLPLRYQEAPPQELPLQPGVKYFELTPESEYDHKLWGGIEQHHNIAIFCNLTSEEIEMQLWSIKTN